MLRRQACLDILENQVGRGKMLDIASEYLLRLELYTDISDAADPVPAQFCITLQKKKKSE